MYPPHLTERIESYGTIGTYLKTYLPMVNSWDPNSTVTNMALIYSWGKCYSSKKQIMAIASSLLLLEYPIQVDVSITLWCHIWTQGLGLPLTMAGFPPHDATLRWGVSTKEQGKLVNKLVADKCTFHRYYPQKSRQPGTNRLNVEPRRLLDSCRRVWGSMFVYQIVVATAGRITDDRLAGLLLYSRALHKVYGHKGVVLAVLLTLYPSRGKTLNTATKALGLNSLPWGAILCEANALAGRAYGTIDLVEEAALRCNPQEVAGRVTSFTASQLRPLVREIIRTELPDGVTLTPLKEFWSRRWLWCVNGSHTNQGSRVLGIDPSFLSRTHRRTYRRSVAETLSEEPISNWDAKVYASPSLKMEHGKTRAIFACDTRSYFAFTWILDTVQKAWLNRRVILDPGKGGHLGIIRRVIEAQGNRGGVNLMLDYDDFNSQHSNEVMSMVFEELCDHISAPVWYKDLLVKSFHSTMIPLGRSWGICQGTLMSGHRATSFINSVLNAAYIGGTCGLPTFQRMTSIHAGDDVYIRYDTISDCNRLLDGLKVRGCKLNPTKQSIGYNSAEFLRLAIRGENAYGYVARAIASFVSGNWTTADYPSPREALQCAVAGSRSLLNRGCPDDVIDAIAPALRHLHGVKRRTLVPLFKGESALEGGPLFSNSYSPKVLVVQGGDKMVPDYSHNWPDHATRDYLQYHCSPIEQLSLELTNCSIRGPMLDASYSKGMRFESGGHSSGGFNSIRIFPCKEPLTLNGYRNASELLDLHDTSIGVLNRYPLLHIVKDHLTDWHIRQLLRTIGVYVRKSLCRLVAFGIERSTTRIQGRLSYSDAAMLCGRAVVGTIWSSINCYI